jgi:carbon monoxide dehydrogenase subunit G
MDFNGSQHFPAKTPQEVWDALLNPSILKECIPGAQKVTITGDQMSILVNVNLPFLNGEHHINARIAQQTPPSHAVLELERAGASSSLSGTVTIDLVPEGAGTKLDYTAHIVLGGKLGLADNAIGKVGAQSALNNFFKQLESKL